ncbi:endolytic transglycosylase MltG [Sulfurospirillum sp. T05]|uniref:Endolytic murein transglycosylase n=1 Tax=Sulfurospirillum tamanense TaxID=2813362 RepID=A0ABS2WRB4_9BACT|nr:endolytic transglycosylase MltG [Sulfurospirillum tamanensis]MBN2964147.1 endolytic transglycosylase MltG [Sulfurospirillum tamanensis]
MQRTKNTNRGVQAFFIACDVIVIILLSLLFYLTRPVTTTSVVYVPSGTIGQIITYLEQRQFNLSPAVDKYLVAFLGWPQSGWIDVGTTRLSRADFYHKLTTAKAAMVPLTLIPGETTEMFFEQVARDFGLSKARLQEAYASFTPYPEGVLFPETYHVPIGIGERHLIFYLVSLSKASHEALAQKIFGEYNERRWYRYVIIASIVQKEAGSVQEMPLVSSVIYNRLKRGMRLQMDGTLNYGPYSNTKVTPQRIREDDSPYNTYKHAGLPPHPVATVSKEALRAAIFPKETEYLYFVRTASGKHTFTKTYAEHQRAMNQGR